MLTRIVETFGRLLCWLGVHDLVPEEPRNMRGFGLGADGRVYETWGLTVLYCARCPHRERVKLSMSEIKRE